VLSFGDFSLHEQRKVTRSSAGRAEALTFNPEKAKQELDSRLRGNDERKTKQKLDSGLRRNDE
jgi:hypothetical protein